MMANTSPAERNHAFAVNNAVVPLAAFAGALIGGLLPGALALVFGIPPDSPAAYRIPMWLTALCYLGGAWLFLATDPDATAQPEAATRPIGTNSRTRQDSRFPYALVAIMMLILFFRLVGDTAANGFFSVYLDTALQVPTSVIGFVSALARLLAVPAALAAPFMIGRLGLGRTFVFSVLILSASLLPLALVATVPGATVGLLGVVAAGMISMTAVTLFHQQIVHSEWRTAMSGAQRWQPASARGL